MRAAVMVSLAVVLWTTVQAAEESDTGRIAYLAHDGDFWQAFSMRPDGSDRRQLTRTAYDKVRLSWFPDGERLLVADNDGRLLEIELATGNERALPLPVAGTHDFAVSPDGSRVAFSATEADGRDNNEIWSMRSDGSHPLKHTQLKWLQHQVTWGPESDWIYFASSNGGSRQDLFRVSIENGSQEQLTVNEGRHFAPAVSREGRLAFSSNRTGDYDIWLQEPQVKPRVLAPHPALDAAPSFSPDGQSLVFQSDRSGRSQIWRVDLAGGEPMQLTSLPGGARDPVWWGKPYGRKP
jgi:Tol biopolymer transport system component